MILSLKLNHNLNLLVGLALILTTHGLNAQVGIGTTQPHPSALLDLSSQDQGLLLPRVHLNNLTKAGLNAVHDAQEGLLVFHTADSLFGGRGLYLFNGAAWQRLAFASPAHQQWQWTSSGVHYGWGDVFIGSAASTNNDLWLSRRLVDWDNSNYFIDPAAGSVLNELKLDMGSAADVSLYWDRPDTGFFAPSQGAMGFSIEGHLKWFLSSEGRFGINTSTPEADFEVNGSVKLGDSGSIISGLKRFTKTYTIPTNWTQDTWVITMDLEELQALDVPTSAFLAVQLRDAPSRQLSISSQGMDQNGFYCTIAGIDTITSGQSFKLDFITLH